MYYIKKKPRQGINTAREETGTNQLINSANIIQWINILQRFVLILMINLTNTAILEIQSGAGKLLKSFVVLKKYVILITIQKIPVNLWYAYTGSQEAIFCLIDRFKYQSREKPQPDNSPAFLRPKMGYNMYAF